MSIHFFKYWVSAKSSVSGHFMYLSKICHFLIFIKRNMTVFCMNIHLNKALTLISRSSFTYSDQINIFLLGQMSSISCHKLEVFKPLLPSLLNFSDIFICEIQYCWLLCCHFTPDAKHAWSTSFACQYSGDEGMGG